MGFRMVNLAAKREGERARETIRKSVSVRKILHKRERASERAKVASCVYKSF